MLQYMGDRLSVLCLQHAATSAGLLVKLVGVEIRSARMEIRLDTIGVLLAKLTAQNFETRRLNSTPTAKSRKRKVYSRGAEFQ